jgi:hypothetical protein
MRRTLHNPRPITVDPARRWSRRQWLIGAGVLTATALGRATRVGRAAAGWLDDCCIGPFRCHADFSLDPYRPLLVDLQRLQSELTSALGIRSASGPVEIILVAERSSYRDLVRRRLRDVPQRRALFIKTGRRSEVLAYRHDQLPVDLRHECTHALLHGALDMVPLWLDEGLAEYFEVPAGQRPHGHPHLRRLRWNMRLGIIPPLKSLENKRGLEEMGPLEYQFSWGWVHFMLHGSHAAHGALRSFLADIQAGTPPGPLSERLMALDAAIERRMIGHFKRWRPV